MKIRVLAVGPSDIEKVIMEVGKEFPELEIYYATYHNEEEVIRVVNQNEADYEFILFAGSLPYQITKDELKLDKPMFYIPFEGTALYRVLFHLFSDTTYDFKAESLTISIDNLQKYEVEESFEELGINVKKKFFYENKVDDDMQNTVQFHYELWKDKQVDVAITCVGSVYEQLISYGVPTLRVIPTRSAVRNSLELILLSAKNSKRLDSQIAVGIIDLQSIYDNAYNSEYQVQRKILALQQIFIDYGEKSQSIIRSDHRELKFITTRGALSLEETQTKEFTLLKEIFHKIEVRVNLGIGIGRTASDAESNAREALKKAKSSNADCFILDSDGKVHGPIGDSVQLSYSIRNNEKKIMDIAKKAKLGSSTINRLLSLLEVKGKTTVTTVELSKGLGITARSARRILNSLENVGLAAVTGEEQPIHRGRPRQIYSILFDEVKIEKEE